MRVAVTEIGRDGSISRRVLDTWQLTDADRWDLLIEQVLAFPPPYRAALGSSIYVIHAGDRAVLVAEQDLTGPLQALVRMILGRRRPRITVQTRARRQRMAVPPLGRRGPGKPRGSTGPLADGKPQWRGTAAQRQRTTRSMRQLASGLALAIRTAELTAPETASPS